MNRKIFTLLAGALLMLVTVFSASAQFQNPTQLKLGDPVEKLSAGPNDYYHLKVEAVSFGNGPVDLASTGAPALPYDYVLYMGNKLEGNNYPLFIAPLGRAGHEADPAIPGDQSSYWATGTNLTKGPWFDLGAPKSQESASSLWCTVVNPYDQGQNITFDFTNKFIKNQMLEVDINGYDILDGWGDPFGDGYITNFDADGAIYTPGGISGWNFSKTYATTVQQVQPLFSYITMDTVAVLCVDINGLTAANAEVGAYIFVKIASAKEVLDGLVPGMLYFTLYEAAPFVLDANDFNSMFRLKTGTGLAKLTFDPDVNPTTGATANLFTAGLFAEHINVATPITFDLPAQFEDDYFGTTGTPQQPIYDFYDDVCLYNKFDNPVDYSGDGGRTIETINSTGFTFDDLGYLYLKKSNTGTDANQYLYAQHGYYTGNAGGDKFLTFGFRTLKNGKATPTNDDLMKDYYLYGQTIWRLVYYPSGDSIYINPFQATYLPTWDAAMLKTAPEADGSATDFGDKTLTWISELTQSSDFYTFRATEDNLLDNATVADMMESRLLYGKDTGNDCVDFYNYYHRNYVTIQNLTGNVKVATLGNGSIRADYTIDTHIFFNVYEGCKESKSDRTTVASDLYLIRSNDGKFYLRIPLHSATDQPEWWALEEDERPDLTPSYQWAVLKRYENSGSSIITLYNREFDGTQLTIQLYNTAMTSFDVLGKTYAWNNKAVNHNTTTLAADNGKPTFIALPKEVKENAKLGYEFIPREVAQVNVYALNFAHAYDHNRYVDWKGDYWRYPNTDTTIFVTGQDHYDRLYFKLDTSINYPLEKYGFKPDSSIYSYKIPYLVQLERQPYFLNFEDPYKLLCTNLFSMVNATQGEYAMGNKEVVNASYLGTPMFNLRHTYFKGNTPYFALVQRLKVETFANNPSDQAQFLAYLTKNYNKQMADIIDTQIDAPRNHTNNDYFMTGVFVAGVDNQTAKLKAMIRADEATTISTFSLVKDDDPIYRRFNTTDEAEVADDTPKSLKFYWMDRPSYEMFENTGALSGQVNYWTNYDIGTKNVEGKKNYLGYVNINQYPSAATSIFVDTAYINRGTGPVKPQYLLMVDPKNPDGTLVCDDDGNFVTVNEDYIRGRYLINATDSARGVGKGISNTSVRATGNVNDPTTHDVNGLPIGRSYLWENNWERLIFTDAIHSYKKDALYLVEGVNLAPYMFEGSDVIDIAKLDAASADSTAAVSTSKPIRKIYLDNNDHKDAVFQMRLIERGAKQFIIESETGFKDNTPAQNRIWGTSYGQLNSNGLLIAPCAGGWIKEQNGTAVISRSNIIFEMSNGMKMDVRKTEAWPTGNDTPVVAAPTVIGGNNAITILGAAGKKVTVSNILGQTVAGAVLASDNATIAAPKGVVVVAIEGEAAVKTLVK